MKEDNEQEYQTVVDSVDLADVYRKADTGTWHGSRQKGSGIYLSEQKE